MSDTSFGVGLALDSDFDVTSDVGQLGIIFGSEVIERDIAFTLAREATVVRGENPDADFASELTLLTRRVLNRDPRIDSVQSIDVDLDPRLPDDPDSGDRTATVSVDVRTASGDTDALLIEL
jgi:hypothetical protein